MIIRSIEVENWRCIDRAALSDLPEGIVVIYGPNRAGKSILFSAVRSCLFDFDHDSQHRSLKSAVPRESRASPKVVVGFETGGTTHRLTKVFSRGRDGMASLERWRDDRWVVVERSPKEASGRAREILGYDSSEAGLNQLLWLDQGTVDLPEERDLDQTLERQLETVLGTLVTAQDLDFREELDRRCRKWFTRTMKPRGGKNPSPVLQYRKKQGELQRRLDEAQRKQEEAEGLVGDFELTEEKVHRWSRLVNQSVEEVKGLEEEELEADAHKYLHELFEECRDSQVRDVMEPVKDRVMDWVHHLGLEDCGDVVFGPRYLPEKLVARDASEDESAVQFTEESYGTREQLSLLVRLAIGGVLARDEPQVAILDDPLAHSDPPKHRRMLDILEFASEGREAGEKPGQSFGRLQLIVLTYQPERFDHLPDARQIDFLHEACGH